jgi:hypothetical protein
MRPLVSCAQGVKENCQPVATDNLFLQWEKIFSGWMTLGLNVTGAT